MDNRLETLLQQIASTAQVDFDSLQPETDIRSLGLRRSARLPVLAALHSAIDSPVLFITDHADHALAMIDELGVWAPRAERLLFPEPAPLFYENASWATARRERLLVMTALAVSHIPGGNRARANPIIVAPVRAVMTRTMPRREFLSATRALKKGQSAPFEQLVRSWAAMGFEAVTTVIAPGQFARRGGILDLWPPIESFPVRIEFFGDEIETIRFFDPATQRTVSPRTISPADKTAAPAVARVLITPAREFHLPAGLAEDPEQATSRIFTEFDIPLLHHQPASLLDYLPSGSVICLDDRQAVEDMVAEIEEQAVKMRADTIAHQILPADFPVPYLSWSELTDSLSQHKVLELGPSFMVEEPRYCEPPAHFSEGAAKLAERFTPGPRFGGRIKQAMEYLAACQQQGEQIVVVSRQTARLHELWVEETGTQFDGTGKNLPGPVFIEATLGEGWVFQPPTGSKINLITDGEIFGWRRPKPRFQRTTHYAIAGVDPEAAYRDLHPGDYVVHVDHGIGRFVALVTRTMEGLEREYLCIEYTDESQLFVPVSQIDRLTRYVGPSGRPPALSRLGSQEWKSVKSHVKEAVQEVAQDLLELSARRSLVDGHRFSQDSTWQEELETSFPYIETEDQLRVLAEVKSDMEGPRPMDRLICGDVGYGKTEVALRAAFKAVNDGKQVAILVPTTVLAQQHHHTFSDRLAAFPVSVEMLSRFRTAQQQRQIIERLAAGTVDIVIGTHRLFSGDVKFKDLGLLIIDEEQRFGVTHKEALKKMRTEVDVLTLTATPIPRTLYMALSGVRDISTINTPPEERLPILTHVGPYSPPLVRQAILRELERGGQIFFVHNRVQTIGAMQRHLEKLIPEARLTVAHGQMPENELSERMEKFSNGEVDILLTTSIIESGLDIPNANTLIVDRADTFGLAQLYQLRGRVGRGAQRAYAYFFRHKQRPPTQEGALRLETIAENTQLGAGFSIAMRDLEIRGTGDILGTRQHGHMAAVGFHLYTRLLSDVVRRMRRDQGLPASFELDRLKGRLPAMNIDLPLPASLPADYIPDKTVRLGIYRRITEIDSPADIEALREEFKDRFGALPDTVQNLLFQARIRLAAEKARLASITTEGVQIVLRYPDDRMPARFPGLGSSIRIGKTALWLPYKQLASWPEELEMLLQNLSNLPVEYPENG